MSTSRTLRSFVVVVLLALCSPGTAYSDEIEPGIRAFGTPVSGNLPGGADRAVSHVMPVAQDGNMELVLTATNFVDTRDTLRMELWTGQWSGRAYQYTPIRTVQASNGVLGSIQFQTLARNTYVVYIVTQQVSGWSGADYSVTAKMVPAMPPDVDDAGDTYDVALPLVDSIPLAQKIDTATDVDYYSFCTGDYGLETLDVTDTAGGNLDVEIQNSYGTILYPSVTIDPTSKQIRVPTLPPGLYFVRVFSLDSTTPTYTISSHFVFADTSSLTDRIGESWSTALQLPPGITLTSDLVTGGNDSADQFLVVQPKTGQFKVFLTNVYLNDTRDGTSITLWPRYGTEVAQSANVGELPDTILLDNLEAGTYCITVSWTQVSGFSGGQYSLRYEPAALPGDIGETTSTALPLYGYKVNAQTGRPLVEQADVSGDVDLYRTWLNDDGSISVTLDEMYNCDVNLELLNSSLTTVLASSGNAGQIPETVSETLPKGTYFVRVTNAGGTSGQYRITPTVENNPTSLVTTDYGQTRDLAFPMMNHLPIMASLTTGESNDYFSFHLDRNELVNISATDLHLIDDRDSIDLILENSAGQTVAQSTRSGSQPELISRILDSGDYYVRVYWTQVSGWSGGVYTLTVDAGSRFGDVSGNGEVTAYDASLVMQYVAGSITLTDDQKGVADVDDSGVINQQDADLILQYAVGKITSFPAEH